MRLLPLLMLVGLVALPASALGPGPRIAFNAGLTTSHPDVVTIAPDGTDLQNLTPGDQFFYTSDLDPSWSPDGTRLLYTRNEMPGSRVYTIGLDGSAPRPLTPSGGFDFGPAWSPDGTKIAFSAPALVVMNADGSDRRQLTQIGTESPSWSPDGTSIAFGGFRTYPQYVSRFGVPSREDVFVIRADGLGLRRL